MCVNLTGGGGGNIMLALGQILKCQDSIVPQPEQGVFNKSEKNIWIFAKKNKNKFLKNRLLRLL